MREIKFRAWQLNGLPNAGYDTFTLDELRSGRYVKNHYENWGQYTGLKDKNGVEIYEGDVLSDSAIMFEVCWSEKGYELPILEAFEVIGNIYSNPELLTKGEN